MFIYRAFRPAGKKNRNNFRHESLSPVEWRWATLKESLDPESNRISEWKEEREYLGASKLLAQVWLHPSQICEMFQAMDRSVSSMPFRTFCLIDKFWQNKCTYILKGLIIFLQHNMLSYQFIYIYIYSFFEKRRYIPRNIPIFILFCMKWVNPTHWFMRGTMAPAKNVSLRIADFAIGGTLKFTVRDKDFGTKDRMELENHHVWRGKSSSEPSFFRFHLNWGVHISSPAAEKGEGQIGKMFSFSGEFWVRRKWKWVKQIGWDEYDEMLSHIALLTLFFLGFMINVLTCLTRCLYIHGMFMHVPIWRFLQWYHPRALESYSQMYECCLRGAG